MHKDENPDVSELKSHIQALLIRNNDLEKTQNDLQSKMSELWSKLTTQDNPQIQKPPILAKEEPWNQIHVKKAENMNLNHHVSEFVLTDSDQNLNVSFRQQRLQRIKVARERRSLSKEESVSEKHKNFDDLHRKQSVQNTKIRVQNPHKIESEYE